MKPVNIYVSTVVLHSLKMAQVEAIVKEIAEAQGSRFVHSGYILQASKSRFRLAPAKSEVVKRLGGFEISFHIKEYPHGVGVRYYCRFKPLTSEGYAFFAKPTETAS